MALQDLLDLSTKRKKIGLSEERIEAIKPAVRQYIAYWREYPDMFIDFLQDGGDPTKEKKLKFFFYQRVFLRAAMRYKYVYMVFPRAYSKSFLSVMVLMCRCILYPRSKLFVTSGGKEQAAGIVKEKVTEICTLVPAFDRELDRRPGKTREGKDYVCYVFKKLSSPQFFHQLIHFRFRSIRLRLPYLCSHQSIGHVLLRHEMVRKIVSILILLAIIQFFQ